jgi:hypothetical protein
VTPMVSTVEVVVFTQNSCAQYQASRLLIVVGTDS